MLLRTGRTAEARPAWTPPSPGWRPSDHHPVLARTLLNRAWLHLGAGRIRDGREDLDRCASVAARYGLHLIAAKVWHNRGYCDLLDGDVPAALSCFTRAEELYHEYGPGFVPVVLAAARVPCSPPAWPPRRPVPSMSRSPPSIPSG